MKGLDAYAIERGDDVIAGARRPNIGAVLGLTLSALLTPMVAPSAEFAAREIVLGSDFSEREARQLETSRDAKARPTVIVRAPVALWRTMTWYVNDLRFQEKGQILLHDYNLTLDIAGRIDAAGNADPQIGAFGATETATNGRAGRDGSPGAFPSGQGQPGEAGEPGHRGRDAGALVLRVSKTSTPVLVRISLTGQSGGNGGNGGRGGNGAPGAKGETAASGPFGCNHGGGNGGSGGRGGDSGSASCGGSGGNGGTVYLSLKQPAVRGQEQSRPSRMRLQAQTATTDAPTRLLPACQPGLGGRAGANGQLLQPGQGGPAGEGGDGSGFCNGGKPGAAGEPGRPGTMPACTPTDGHPGGIVLGEPE